MARPAEFAYNLGIEGKMRYPAEGEGWRDDYVHVFVGQEMAPGWFGWIIPTGDGMVRVGIGSSGPVKPIECYRRLTAAFPNLRGIEAPDVRRTIPLTCRSLMTTGRCWWAMRPGR
jgi:flavin-dependent dehydrogenase